jgi:hypothetical protein
MDWSTHLAVGESVLWEGRPAPRCYVFRNWRHSFFGVLLLLLSVFWLTVGLQLSAVYHSPLLAWVPVPFVLAGLYLALGHHLQARLEWEQVFYALTDRRLLVHRGLCRRRVASLLLAEVNCFQLRPLGEQLGTLRVSGGHPVRTLILCCIEHPRQLADRLEAVLAAGGKEVPIERTQKNLKPD